MDCAVRFTDVCKEYPFYQHMKAGLKSFLFHLPKHLASLKQSRFIALNNVSFEVRKGETFGIIGRNGSGKSTILGLMAGVIQQDRGRVETSGKISSLLELGAGFHPDLSGLENIILNGILMGNTRKEMEERTGAIIEFSELGDFIYQPLRTYSSGMHVRLGFSVAVHIDPEILLVDEALAVGDIGFQEKCLAKLKDFKKAGATIIFVSHDMDSIEKLCDRAVWINEGSIREIGLPAKVVRRYVRHLERPSSLETDAADGRDDDSDRDAIQGGESSGSSSLSPRTWWDSPAVLRAVEDRITGSSGLNFYAFLQGLIGSVPLERGLSVCNQLQGLEGKFISFGICRSFDTLSTEDERQQFLDGELDSPRAVYECVLLVDVLSRSDRPEGVLETISSLLTPDGYLFMIEKVSDLPVNQPEALRGAGERLLAAVENATGQEGGSLSRPSRDILAAVGKTFSILAVRPFGSPLYELLFNPLSNVLDEQDRQNSRVMGSLVSLDGALTETGLMRNSHAVIIARRRGEAA